MSLKKIAIFHPRMDLRGGAEQFVEELYKKLKARNHSVVLFCRHFKPDLWPHISSSDVLWFKTPSDFLFPSLEIDLFYLSKVIYKKFSNFDLIIANNHPSTVWAAALKDTLSTKLAWYCHEPRRDYYPEFTDKVWMGQSLVNSDLKEEADKAHFRLAKNKLKKRVALDKKVIQQMDYLFANSAYTASLIKEIYGREALVSYPFIKTQIIGEAKKIILTRPKNKFETVGILASSFFKKNFSRTLAQAVSLMKTRLQLKLVIAGSNPSFFLKDIENSGIEASRIQIVQIQSDLNLCQFYQGIDFLFYIPFDEPYGLVPVEAALFGVPSILSDHAGPRELAQKGLGVCVSPFANICESSAYEVLCKNFGDAGEIHRTALSLADNPYLFEILNL